MEYSNNEQPFNIDGPSKHLRLPTNLTNVLEIPILTHVIIDRIV